MLVCIQLRVDLYLSLYLSNSLYTHILRCMQINTHIYIYTQKANIKGVNTQDLFFFFTILFHLGVL